MYPLNMQLPSPAIGYAVANDESEHIALSDFGYEPAFVSQEATSDDQGHTVESVRSALDAAGIEYDKRWGLAKLVALLPKE